MEFGNYGVQGIPGPQGPAGAVGPTYFTPEERRIFKLRRDLEYSLWYLGTTEQITEEEFDSIIEMIHSSDLDNLGVAEVIITTKLSDEQGKEENGQMDSGENSL